MSVKKQTKYIKINLMKKRWKIFNIFVVSIWAVLIIILLYRNYAGIPLEKLPALSEAFGKDTYWYDIYAGDKKIGYASTIYEKAGNELIIKHQREIEVQKNGKDTILIEKIKCLCDLSYSIKSFDYESSFQNEPGIKVIGDVGPDTIIFFLESDGKRKVYKIPKKDFYFPITIIPVLVQQKPAADATFTIPFLNIANLSIDDMRIVLEEIRPIKAGIQILSLYKFKSGNAIWWGNEKGIIIKEESLPGITLYSQVETIAKDPSDRILFDYTSLPFFKSGKVIQDPEKLKTLKVRIKGFRLDPMLYENSLISFDNDTLTIRKEDPEEIKQRSYPLPYKGEALSRYLKADEWVLSDHKTVKGNALNMATIEKNDAFRLARYLNSNLYFSVRVMPMFVLSDALDIFKSHLGDYRERTVMFASFSRAVGLPTRLIGGLVLKNGYFYYHTWPEAWFGRWVPVDPTFAEFPADVTHIPLKEGHLKEITSIINDLKSISIEILEAS